MSKLDLYDTANFASDSFNILNEHLGPLDISGEVFVDDASIGLPLPLFNSQIQPMIKTTM